MNTFTIPKKVTKGEDLIVLPRSVFEVFVRIYKNKKFYTEFDRDLDEALKEFESGKAVGPFSSVRELRKSLEK